jgi:hypothetical protein
VLPSAAATEKASVLLFSRRTCCLAAAKSSWFRWSPRREDVRAATFWSSDNCSRAARMLSEISDAVVCKQRRLLCECRCDFWCSSEGELAARQRQNCPGSDRPPGEETRGLRCFHHRTFAPGPRPGCVNAWQDILCGGLQEDTFVAQNLALGTSHSKGRAVLCWCLRQKEDWSTFLL